MDRLSRKELKTDHFVEEVEHGVEYVAGHRKQFAIWGGAAVVVLLAGGGVYYFMNSQQAVRAEALGKALAVQAAPFGPAQGDVKPEYPTESARDQAAAKVFQEVITKYGSSEQGQTAKYFLGAHAANEAKWSEAEKLLKEASSGGSADVSSLAKLSLAQVFAAQSKPAEAEALLRDLVAKPTRFVSKDQASLELGRLLKTSKPAEGKKLLEDLRAGRGPVSKAAINALTGEQ
jgi:predicted negative regulator of RcsB-dependent stress response